MWQTTDAVLMVRPASFGANPETAASNAFQASAATGDDVNARAVAEFDRAARALQDAGVRTCIVDDIADPRRPDAVFPNNWLTTHEDGTVALYPMFAPSRRSEVRRDVVDALTHRFGYRVSRVLDLTGWARRNVFLEGTGSMVLDRVSRTAFACLSPRTDAQVLTEFCHEFDYAPHTFTAVDASGTPIYHTNVMMWIGTQAAAVCFDSLPDPAERDRVRGRLSQGGRRVLELTLDQMGAFAGNALELRADDTQPVIALSASAHRALTAEQLDALTGYARLAIADLDTIESCSGGSFRCMLAEIFLPR